MTAEEPAEEPKKKRVKPPKGFAELPEWWLEITPHGTLYPDEDEVRRHNASQEARMYKNLAAQSDWEQANKEKYSLGENGELIDKKTGKPIEIGSGYTRDEKSGEWLKDGKAIFGRQFKTSVSTPDYGHKDTSWEKPEWMKLSPYFTERLYFC